MHSNYKNNNYEIGLKVLNKLGITLNKEQENIFKQHYQKYFGDCKNNPHLSDLECVLDTTERIFCDIIPWHIKQKDSYIEKKETNPIEERTSREELFKDKLDIFIEKLKDKAAKNYLEELIK